MKRAWLGLIVLATIAIWLEQLPSTENARRTLRSQTVDASGFGSSRLPHLLSAIGALRPHEWSSRRTGHSITGQVARSRIVATRPRRRPIARTRYPRFKESVQATARQLELEIFARHRPRELRTGRENARAAERSAF